MKTIGLLGGTGWSSTIGYYTLLNQIMNEKLGGYHSAKVILKSIDYHEIMVNYGKDHEIVSNALKRELKELISLKPDCFMICCNSLHKYYDIIKNEIETKIPIMHAIELVVEHACKNDYKNVLLLATKFTMQDGFFEKILREKKINVIIPNGSERNKMQEIHGELMRNVVTPEAKNYFSDLVKKYDNNDAVVLGCTEFPLVLNEQNAVLPIIDPVNIQCLEAVQFALGTNIKNCA